MMQITLDGKQIDEVAIDRIRQFEPSGGYYLAFSGGKDSVVIYDLAVRSGVRFDAHYNVSPIDPPEIYRFIREHYPDVAWDKYASGFWTHHFMSNGLPTRLQRWCCKVIKEAGGIGRTKILGTRWQESINRRGRKVFEVCRQSRLHSFSLHPIVDWSVDDVWQYIHEQNLPYCSLYDQGYKRIGCVLCPFQSKADKLRAIDRWPKIARNWRLASDRYFQVRIDRGTPLRQTTPEDYWEWWFNL